jgi:arylsulfatase A-like enzyme
MSCRAFSKMSFLFVVVAFVCGGLRAEVSDHRKPNVVYMMLDEIGYFELSSMGHKILKTPNIDRLGSEGMRFTQCLAGGPTCAPTRSVLLTGKHLGHTQIRGNRVKGHHISIALTQDEFTLGEMFKSAGYVTGGFGKWGLGDTERFKGSRNALRGRESLFRTEREARGNLRPCHDDCEVPAADMPTSTQTKSPDTITAA